MNWKIALGILAVPLLAGAAALGYFLPTWGDAAAGPLEQVEYSESKDLLEVLEAELRRLQRRQIMGNMDGLHPRTIALLEEHGTEVKVQDFAKIVGHELFKIRRQIVEDFSRRNPDITQVYFRDGDLYGSDLNDRDTASLPAALSTTTNEFSEIMNSFPESPAKQLIEAHDRTNCDVPRLIAHDLDSYTAFMEASRVAEERLQAVLAKRRIVAFVPPGVDPEDAISFPLPVSFDTVVTARIMVYLAMGENEHAATSCRNMLELLRRAQFGRNQIGSLLKIVVAARLQ
jgi:hypothetical protein